MKTYPPQKTLFPVMKLKIMNCQKVSRKHKFNNTPISSSDDPASLKNKPQDDENTSKDDTKENFDSITDDNNTSETKSTDKKSTDKITHHLSGDQVVGSWSLDF